jgi:hypothetical protein
VLGPTLLLRIAATWSLPGLGLLAIAAGPTPYLAGYPLHTALAVEAVLPAGQRHQATATVEEVSRDAGPERGLLLDFGIVVELPAGTEIWLAE